MGSCLSQTYLIAIARRSAAWFFMTARRTTSKSSLESPRRHRASRPIKSVRLRIYLRASWLVDFVKLFPSRYERSRSTSHNFARYSRCVVSYCCSVSVSERNWYLIGFVVSSGCFCRERIRLGRGMHLFLTSSFRQNMVIPVPAVT